MIWKPARYSIGLAAPDGNYPTSDPFFCQVDSADCPQGTVRALVGSSPTPLVVGQQPGRFVFREILDLGQQIGQLLRVAVVGRRLGVAGLARAGRLGGEEPSQGGGGGIVPGHDRRQLFDPELREACGLGELAVLEAVVIDVIDTDVTEPINLWVIVAMDPSARKSPVFAAATRPLRAWEARRADEMGPEIALAQAKLDVEEARLKTLKSQASRARGPDLEDLQDRIEQQVELVTSLQPQVPERILASDATPEESM